MHKLIAVLFVALFLLVGCVSDSSDSPEAPGNQQTEAPAVDQPVEPPVVNPPEPVPEPEPEEPEENIEGAYTITPDGLVTVGNSNTYEWTNVAVVLNRGLIECELPTTSISAGGKIEFTLDKCVNTLTETNAYGIRLTALTITADQGELFTELPPDFTAIEP